MGLPIGRETSRKTIGIAEIDWNANREAPNKRYLLVPQLRGRIPKWVAD